MSTRSAVGVLLALLLAGSALATAGPVQAEPAEGLTGTPLDCDGVVAVPGGYLLTRDTDCDLSWREGESSFDLGGHTFTGRFDFHFLARGDRRVHDGTLRIRDHARWVGGRHTFSRVRIQPAPDTAPDYFFIRVFAGFTLEDSVVEDVPGVVFDVYDGANGVTIRNSIFRHNGRPLAIQKGSDALIEGNWFVDNGTGVLLWPEDGNGVNGNVIRRNIFVANGAAAYVLARCNSLQCTFGAGRGPALDNNRIEQNLIVNSRFSGITVLKRCEESPVKVCISAAGNVIRGNIITGSGYDPAATLYDDGITARGTSLAGNIETPYPQALAGFLLSGNLAIHNADLGFDVFGVTDGGRNLAVANGNRDQCDGVRCTLRRPPHSDLAGAPFVGLDDLMPLRPHPETEAESDLAS